MAHSEQSSPPATNFNPNERQVEGCRICDSKDIRPFLVVPDNGHLRTADVQLPVWSCDSCGVRFLNPFPQAELGARYFALSYGAPAKSLYYDDGFKKHVSRVRLDEIGHQGPPGRRLLDVGCGKGQFVGVALERGWDAWGVEFDEGAVAAARDNGISTVLAGSLDHPDLPALFDLITLWDVIEHLQDPRGVMAQVASRLAPQGIVVVRTANIDSAIFARNPLKWWAFGVDHRFYFSPTSLTALLRGAGFRVGEALNLEPLERPEKRGYSWSRDPRRVVRHLLNRIRYGRHYWTSLMTVVGRKIKI